MIRSHLVAGTVAGLVLFSACSQAAPPATQPVASAPAGSAAAPSDGGGAANADDLISRMATAQAGVKTYSMDMTMDTSVMGEAATISMSGKVDQSDPANIKMDMNSDFAGMKMKMLQLGDEMYLQLDAAGDTWMKVPADQKSEYDSTAGSMDLADKLQQAKDAIKQVEAVGEDTVDGTKTTHYLITIDGSALAKLTGSDGVIDADTFTYDVWLDDASLVRKVSMNLKVTVDDKSMPLKVEGTMGHYNEPVEIKAPAKDKIVDMPS